MFQGGEWIRKRTDTGRLVGKILQWSRWEIVIAWTTAIPVEIREEHGF